MRKLFIVFVFMFSSVQLFGMLSPDDLGFMYSNEEWARMRNASMGWQNKLVELKKKQEPEQAEKYRRSYEERKQREEDGGDSEVTQKNR